MVDGSFYCPAVPDDLITASADKRAASSTAPCTKRASRLGASWHLCTSKGRSKCVFQCHADVRVMPISRGSSLSEAVIGRVGSA